MEAAGRGDVRVRGDPGRGAVGIPGLPRLGHDGPAGNTAPSSFWTASVGETAEKLAAIVHQEQAEVLTCYDDNGGYGQPDHIQVHRVGLRAAELAGTPRANHNTMNRDHMARGFAALADQLGDSGIEVPQPEGWFGRPEAVLTMTA